MVLLSLAYIPRALNNREVNDAMVQMSFIGRWKVDELSLWAESEDITHFGHDSNKAFWQFVNRWYPLDRNRVLKVIAQETGADFFLT